MKTRKMTNLNWTTDEQIIVDEIRSRTSSFAKRDIFRDVNKSIPWEDGEQLVGRVVDKMARRGEIERLGVRREWDPSVGYQSNYFGGAAVMMRRRAYFQNPS